ncbi:MAG: hypothetical protein QXG07_03740 [Desulfurococcaceae archaeon]
MLKDALRNSMKERVREFIERYGDKAIAVLKAALELSSEAGCSLGDFNSRDLALRLTAWGIDYNPSNLIRILEKVYGIIEKGSTSRGRAWYRFRDIDAVREELFSYMGYSREESPRIKVLRIKYRSLRIDLLMNKLRSIITKERLSKSDLEFIKDLAFKELDGVLQLIDEMSENESYFIKELKALKELVELADAASLKITEIEEESLSMQYSLENADTAIKYSHA